ncbi:hypothetical protein ACLUW9_08645 [Limosilactobacillus mucosae]|uniref:hypothetical protein n=1 Tax=Limosilactobacillus mucosae TaxID=97478 RepID=UPI003991F2CA
MFAELLVFESCDVADAAAELLCSEESVLATVLVCVSGFEDTALASTVEPVLSLLLLADCEATSSVVLAVDTAVEVSATDLPLLASVVVCDTLLLVVVTSACAVPE